MHVVVHIHDEVIVEGLFSESDRATVQSILETPPEWAKGLPLSAKCWIAERYQK